MKGRPLEDAEVRAMLDALPAVVGEHAVPSWSFLLNGVLNSGLRLEEMMDLSWNIPGTIQPRWPKNGHPVLLFPGSQQKNGKTQEVPMTPWFAEQLSEVLPTERTGHVFNPESLQARIGRTYHGERLTADRVGKIVTQLGRTAGIVVDDGDPAKGKPAKYASLHDLRRTFAQRLKDSGLPMGLIQRLMRHSDAKTTERYYLTEKTQLEAERIQELLAKNSRLRVVG